MKYAVCHGDAAFVDTAMLVIVIAVHILILVQCLTPGYSCDFCNIYGVTVENPAG